MELTIDDALQRGIAAHRRGKLQEAARFYRIILKEQPKHADANHNLGIIAIEVGKVSHATQLFKIALESNPNVEQFWVSYIDSLIREQKFETAKKALIDGTMANVSADKLSFLEDKLDSLRHDDKKNKKRGLSFSERRKREAEQKRDKKAKRNLTIGGPPQHEINHLLTQFQSGQLIKAEKLARALTTKWPAYSLAWGILGGILKQTGRKKASLDAQHKAVELSPEDAMVHNNLGIALQEVGRLDEAEASLRQSISLKTDFAGAHYNLGNILRQLDRMSEAVASYKEAVRIQPDYAKSYNNLGATLKEMGRLKEAEANYRQAISIQLDYAEAHNNLGIILKEQDRLHESEASFRKAIKFNASYTEAHLNLCELYEKTNKINEMLAATKIAKINVIDFKDEIALYEALANFRNEDYEQAAKILKNICENEIRCERKTIFFKLKGELAHYNKDYENAFIAYERMNRIIKSSPEYQQSSPKVFLESQKEKIAQIEYLTTNSVPIEQIRHEWYQPTFLIGFPRSGTTLLDTVLRTHSEIEVVEEQPMVRNMKSRLGNISKITEIEAIDARAAKVASASYLEELGEHAKLSNKSTVIDKLPLNILELPLINMIFPEAHFILSLRHPFDCIFSCWTQVFRLNSAMANMVDLSTIVELYCTTMTILKLCQKRYSLNVHEVRYEDLVFDLQGTATNVLNFLGLNWQDELYNFQATAKTRKKISTPSYSQVIKPIYNTASYRWKNYDKHFEPHKTLITPWLREFGY